MFQDPGSSLNSRRTIEKSMEVPLDIHDKMSKEEKEKRVEELLEMVGLPKDYKNKMPRNIGGGERQLVSVARALATNPELIIPVSYTHLDVYKRQVLYRMNAIAV